MSVEFADLLKWFVSQGILGTVAALFIVLYLRKDKELSEERAARIADSKDGYKLWTEIQTKMTQTIDRASDMTDNLLKVIQQRGRGGM